MRINGHAHIFNLQTVLTSEALAILVSRMRTLGVKDFVAEAVGNLLQQQLAHPEYLVEEELLRRFLRAVTRTGGYRQFVAGAAALPVEIQLLGDGVESLAVDSLRAALDKLSTRLDEHDALGRGVHDVYEVLRLAMQADIVSVADRLLAQLRPDDALVALMMDIVAPDEKKRDRANFLAQLRGTADAALARPGRILPFVAVNPLRPDHFAIMVRAIEEMGFLGVKLYPSLGYRVDTPEMARVLDFCVERDVPVLMHASRGGFFKSAETAAFCAPLAWRALLTGARRELRLCFAHCGGWGGFSGQDPVQAEWSDEIFRLMDEFPHVYADLSYHVDMMGGGPKEDRYLEALRGILEHPTYRSRIIFGTDSWLLRFQLTEESYWRYYETKLGERLFALIAEAAPTAFLGLPADGRAARANVKRHVAFLVRNRDRVGAEPTPWVRAMTDATFVPGRADPRWSPNNRAHVLTYQFLRFEVKQVPAQHHPLRFDGSGKLRLRQLGYWRKEHEDAAIFAQRVGENARNLDVFLRHNGAAYEGDYDTGPARERLAALFGEGDRQLADLAAAVDAIYLFPSELA